MKVKDLKPADYNPRTISESKLGMLGKSLKEFGDLSGVVFNVTTGNLVGGHQRLKHLEPDWEIVKEPGVDETGTVAVGYIVTPRGRLAYREVAWPIGKEIQANIAANHHGGVDDPRALAKLFKNIGRDQDASVLGFRENDIKTLFKRTEGKRVGLKEGFEVVVSCGGEEEMQATFEKLQGEGYACRLLIF